MKGHCFLDINAMISASSILFNSEHAQYIKKFTWLTSATLFWNHEGFSQESCFKKPSNQTKNHGHIFYLTVLTLHVLARVIRSKHHPWELSNIILSDFILQTLGLFWRLLHRAFSQKFPILSERSGRFESGIIWNGFKHVEDAETIFTMKLFRGILLWNLLNIWVLLLL